MSGLQINVVLLCLNYSKISQNKKKYNEKAFFQKVSGIILT